MKTVYGNNRTWVIASVNNDEFSTGDTIVISWNVDKRRKAINRQKARAESRSINSPKAESLC